MRYFFDTEFIEDGKTIELISIGIVDVNGRPFYAESSDVDLTKANPWVQENVIPNLRPEYRYSRAQIAKDIVDFVNQGKDGNQTEFWAYYADYDWVVLCQLYGRMIDLPDGWPMFCHDIKQEVSRLGNPKLPKQSNTEHNALNDALWNKEVFEWLSVNLFCDWPVQS